jgi:hypothetical protein
MTPEQINQRIAKHLGWTEISSGGSGRLLGKRPGDGRAMWVPDYYHDLNACHEMEKLFEAKTIFDLYGPDLAEGYVNHLSRICIGHFGGRVRATAPQRCEALLRTVGKWNS